MASKDGLWGRSCYNFVLLKMKKIDGLLDIGIARKDFGDTGANSGVCHPGSSKGL